MSKGFYTAQEGHVVPVLAPVDITGGKTGAAFSMKNHAHASILVQVGVSAAAFTKIIVNACTDKDGTNPTAIPFDIFACETANADVTGARTAVAVAGYTPSANDGIFYVIELDAAQLPQGSPYVQLQLTNGANSVIASAVAILSGGRYINDQSATVLA
jgi:hypothetical protein